MSLYQKLASRYYEGDFNYAFNMSLKHKYIYVETAKAACTTLKSILGEWEFSGCNLGDQIPQTYLQNVHVNVLGTPFVKPFQFGAVAFEEAIASREFFVFGFVRNPFTRLLSAYLDKILGEFPESQSIVEEAATLGIHRSAGNLSFVEFLRCVESQASRHMVLDKHWRPQAIQLPTDLVEFGFIGRVEHFKDDMDFLYKRLGFAGAKIDRVYGHETGAPSLLRKYYDDEATSLVTTLYKEDFSIFGYEPAVVGQ